MHFFHVRLRYLPRILCGGHKIEHYYPGWSMLRNNELQLLLGKCYQLGHKAYYLRLDFATMPVVEESWQVDSFLNIYEYEKKLIS